MNKDTNRVVLFSLALGLQESWFIEGVELVDCPETSTKELHLHINFRKGFEFTTVDGLKVKGYDTEERFWRHLDFFRHKCFLYARVPRVDGSDGKVRTVSVPGHVQAPVSPFC
jgi:hypothetical protein